MRRDQIRDDLSELAFDFFFWFSKFESALKEARYLDPNVAGATARPHWKQFVKAFEATYEATPAALELLEAKPQRQVVAEHGLDFEEVHFADNVSRLGRVVILTKTVRNNLFHGGKHGSTYWDNPERMRMLMTTATAVLHDLAEMSGLPDYTGYY